MTIEVKPDDEKLFRELPKLDALILTPDYIDACALVLDYLVVSHAVTKDGHGLPVPSLLTTVIGRMIDMLEEEKASPELRELAMSALIIATVAARGVMSLADNGAYVIRTSRLDTLQSLATDMVTRLTVSIATTSEAREKMRAEVGPGIADVMQQVVDRIKKGVRPTGAQVH